MLSAKISKVKWVVPRQEWPTASELPHVKLQLLAHSLLPYFRGFSPLWNLCFEGHLRVLTGLQDIAPLSFPPLLPVPIRHFIPLFLWFPVPCFSLPSAMILVVTHAKSGQIDIGVMLSDVFLLYKQINSLPSESWHCLHSVHHGWIFNCVLIALTKRKFQYSV